MSEEPEAVEPEVGEPEAVESEAVEPEAVEPEAVEPEAVEPEGESAIATRPIRPVLRVSEIVPIWSAVHAQEDLVAAAAAADAAAARPAPQDVSSPDWASQRSIAGDWTAELNESEPTAGDTDAPEDSAESEPASSYVPSGYTAQDAQGYYDSEYADEQATEPLASLPSAPPTPWPPPRGRHPRPTTPGPTAPGQLPPGQLVPPPPVQPARRRPSGRLLTVLLLVILLLVAAATAIVVFVRSAGPAEVVRSYFTALSDADAPKALSLAAPPSGDRHLLTTPVLRVQQQLAPMSNLVILNSEKSGDRAVVSFSYALGRAAGPETVRDSVVLQRHARKWRLSVPAASTKLTLQAETRRATVGGRPVPSGPVLLFPGVAPVEFDTPLLQQTPDSDVIKLDSTAGVMVTAQLSSDAVGVLTNAAKAAMTACLKSGTKAEPDCPLTPDNGRVVPGSLHGTVSDLTLSSPPSLSISDPDGLVGLAGKFSINGTWTTLDYDNLPLAQSGLATITFTASVYVSRPDDVQFEASG